MSMQQALGVVGGIVGSFFGYPQLGFVVGSLVGAALTPKEKTEGPRLDDLKVTVSTYGVGIPILYGTERMGGNVIWSTDKIEVATTEEQGKGGGAEYTSYKYYVHMAVALCETPRDGSEVSIQKIFKNGKLHGDASPQLTAALAIASVLGTTTTSIDESPDHPVLYQGSADQLPNPFMEAWAGGAGSVPAYRGIVYAFMPNVECPNGQVPQFSFVLSNSFQADPAFKYGNEYEIPTWTVGGLPVHSRVQGSMITMFTQDVKTTGLAVQKVITVYGLGPDYFARVRSFAVEFRGSVEAMGGAADIDAICMNSISPLDVDSGDLVIIDEYGTVNTLHLGVVGFSARYGDSMWAKRGDRVIVKEDSLAGIGRAALFDFPSGDLIALDTFPELERVWLTQSYAWFMCTNLPVSSYRIEIRSREDFSLIAQAPLPSSTFGSGLVSPQSDSLAIVLPGAIELWEIDATGAATYVATGAGSIGGDPRNPIRVHQMQIIGWNGLPEEASLYVGDLRAITTSPFKVSDIIADLCERAGETRFDVSGIPDTDTVQGYKISAVASARANIQPLLDGFGIYAVDEDGLIKFKKRAGIVSVATVGYDELGQAEDGAEPGDPMPLNHTQEIDLPRSATCNYIEPAFDYQTASEPYLREVTDSIEDIVIDLPIALNSSDQAKEVAQRTVYERALAQNTRTCKLSRKYAFVSPGDGLTIEYPRGTWRLWFVSSTTDTGALCEFNLQPGDSQLMEQTAVGSTGYAGQQITALPAPTQAQILDIPILRDVDNNAGLYVALDSYASVPASAELLVGDIDDPQTMESQGTVSKSAPIGYAETVLGTASSGFVDESNLVTVNLGDDVFESVTRDVLLAGGGEFWAYGAPGRWEIGASALGDSLGSGRFTLSRHLRGLFGTEQYTGTHEVGDSFVLLRIAGMLRPNLSVGDIGQTKFYRAVTKGRSSNSAPSQEYVSTAEGLKPLSPINLRRTDTNGLTIDRRSRLSMNNSTGSLPLGETTEAYSWSFYTTSGFTTLIGTAVTNTAAISSVQITAAGATPTGTLYVRVSQISDSVGKGHELQATA